MLLFVGPEQGRVDTTTSHVVSGARMLVERGTNITVSPELFKFTALRYM